MAKSAEKKPTPLFAAFRDGVCLMSTEYESCIPPMEQLKSMAKAGYKFKMNGAAYTPSARGKKA